MENYHRYFIVTGSNRSGTSCMMYALRHCGIPIIGYRFPVTFDDGTTGDSIYLTKKSVHYNPTGFWEIPEIIKNGLTDEVRKYDGYIVKIMVTELLKSKLGLFDGIIWMIRDPRKCIVSQLTDVAKSQFEMKLNLFSLVWVYNFMFAFTALKKKHIPIKFVMYEELLEKPEEVLKGVCKFIGRGEAKYGAEKVYKELDRTKALLYENEGLKIAFEFYNVLLTKDSEKIGTFPYRHIKDKIDAIWEENQRKINKGG